MKSLLPLLLSSSALLAALANEGKPQSLQIEATGVPTLTLRGKDARQQLLVTAKLDSNLLRDFTHKVTYKAAPVSAPGISLFGDEIQRCIEHLKSLGVEHKINVEQKNDFGQPRRATITPSGSIKCIINGSRLAVNEQAILSILHFRFFFRIIG